MGSLLPLLHIIGVIVAILAATMLVPLAFAWGGMDDARFAYDRALLLTGACGIGLYRLDLGLGHRWVTERRQFRDGGIQGRAQLLGQAPELTEQFIRAQPRHGHRTLSRHSDGFTPTLRLLL